LVRSRTVRTLAAVGVVLMLASSLGGCGRKGRLLPPPDPSAPPEDAKSTDATKSGIHKKPRNPPIIAPQQPFILDPLL
jgi:predicted small lipoprotein YifL